MRLGLLADIHEHNDDLRAALRVFQREHVDQVVLLGDVFELGERIEETCQLLKEVGAVGVWGNGKIVIGYSLLDQFHGKGFATEALRGFLDWARRHPDLRKVVADTFPHLTASIRVLEKNGFVRSGVGTDEGSIRFELSVR